MAKLVGKSLGPTEDLQPNMVIWSGGKEKGMPSVVVKCEDIRRTTSGEGDFLDDN